MLGTGARKWKTHSLRLKTAVDGAGAGNAGTGIPEVPKPINYKEKR